MKKLLIIAAIGIASLATAPAAKAQVHLSVNLGIQPDWGPRGYDHVDYYYLPDVDSYYDVPSREYVYLEGGSWVHRRYLPSRYRGYDLYGGRKVVINSRNPWARHNEYHTRYVTNYRGGGYRGGYNRGGFGGGPRGGYHGNPGRGGFDHGGPGRGGFGGNHGGGNPGSNHGGGFGGNHGGGNPGGNHGGGNPGGNHGGGNPGGGNHGGGGRGGDNHGGGHRG